MSRLISLATTKYSYNKETKTFTFSEKDVPFDTSYEVLNPQTGNRVVFDFKESTGPEFDPTTKWIYRTADGRLTLEVCNDPKITYERSVAYLDHKLNRESRYLAKHN